MSALLRRREIDVRALDLNDAISEVLRLVDGESKRHGVVLESHLSETVPPVSGDRVHLQPVVLNLVVNGMEAAAESPAAAARKVIVRTARAGVGEVEVSVHDTGPGISPDHMSRLFDSFVTTKKEGMGLGRSIARSLIEAPGVCLDSGVSNCNRRSNSTNGHCR
jgi:signal transduction histidine kinase